MSRVLPPLSPPTRWRPSPVIAGSVGLHCLAVLGALLRPEAWPLAAGAIAANQALLTAAGLWPSQHVARPQPHAAARGRRGRAARSPSPSTTVPIPR